MEVALKRLNILPECINISQAGLHDTTFEELRIPIFDRALTRGSQYLIRRDHFQKNHA